MRRYARPWWSAGGGPNRGGYCDVESRVPAARQRGWGLAGDVRGCRAWDGLPTQHCAGESARSESRGGHRAFGRRAPRYVACGPTEASQVKRALREQSPAAQRGGGSGRAGGVEAAAPDAAAGVRQPRDYPASWRNTGGTAAALSRGVTNRDAAVGSEAGVFRGTDVRRAGASL